MKVHIKGKAELTITFDWADNNHFWLIDSAAFAVMAMMADLLECVEIDHVDQWVLNGAEVPFNEVPQEIRCACPGDLTLKAFEENSGEVIAKITFGHQLATNDKGLFIKEQSEVGK